MTEIAFIILFVAALVAGLWIGTLTERHKNRARNAAHAECVECPHHTPKSDVRAAQSAARAHRAETGHMAIVVVN